MSAVIPVGLAAPDAAALWSSAAQRAGIRIRPATDAKDALAAMQLITDVWGPDSRIASAGLLVALAHSGNHVAIAEDSEGVAGVCAGFVHAERRSHLHSHVAASRPGTSGRGIGQALKLEQRAWALERGISTITWTYDPLIRRNAHFNLTRLGARAVTYLPDHYGPMQDALNFGEPSDRLHVEWTLENPAAAPLSTQPVEDVLADVDGLPVIGSLPANGARVVAVPADIEGLRIVDTRRAHAWRLAVRDVLDPALAEGWTIAGFLRERGYLIRKA